MLHPPTIGLLLICYTSLQAAFMVLYARSVQRYPGVNEWALGNVLFAVGSGITVLRDFLPLAMSSVLANPLIILGGVFFYQGAALFVGHRYYRRLSFAVPLLLLVFLGYSFAFLQDNNNFRAIATSLCAGPIVCAAAYMLLAHWDRSAWLAGGAFGAVGVFYLIRIPVLMFVEPLQDVFIASPFQVVTLLFFLLGTTLWTLGVTLLITRRLAADLNQTNREVSQALQQADMLLLNVLPPSIATRMKKGERELVDHFPESIVLFADIVNFTVIAQQHPPAQLVNRLNAIFKEFDELARHYGLEKIKTIGDCYMAVSGLPVPRTDYAKQAAEMALEIQVVAQRLSFDDQSPLRLRIGLHAGEVVAGVIGTSKFTYDLWGDTVNTASRMESHGEPGKIQCSQAVYEHLNHEYEFQFRGEINVKGKGMIRSYFLVGKKPQL